MKRPARRKHSSKDPTRPRNILKAIQKKAQKKGGARAPKDVPRTITPKPMKAGPVVKKEYVTETARMRIEASLTRAGKIKRF